ncbi:MAG TPA: hypothetical protein VGK22_03770 [Candidatus Angelobacter sp.]
MANLTLPKSVEDAVARYKAALEKYELVAERESPSYSVIELPKLEIADALLESLGLPTSPRTAK